MACRRQEVSIQQLQLVALNRAPVGRARQFINVVGTMTRRMRSPFASLRWELAKRRVPQNRNLPEPENARAESAVAMAGF